jgi:hypothetical protein
MAELELEQRRERVGMPIDELCMLAAIPYHRGYRALRATLTEQERARMDRVLRERELRPR